MGEKQKFYAVRAGETCGIYTSWAECEPLVHGVKGVKYKSFPTRAEAEAFLENCSTPAVHGAKKERTGVKKESFDETSVLSLPPDTLVVFVDGSYDVRTQRYGYGCVFLTPTGETVCKNGSGDHPEAVSARNVAGELLATMAAFRYAEQEGYQNLKVFHDYSGISAWFTGAWKANSYVAKEYVAVAEAYRGRLNVTFEKVAAHTGVKYNEMADRLAKEALGLLE